jgi:hypothetical protein
LDKLFSCPPRLKDAPFATPTVAMPQDTTGQVITGRDVSRKTGFATRHAEDDSGGGEGLGRELFVSGAHEHQDRFDQH